MNLASSKRQWPLGRGFERFYGFLGARDEPVVSRPRLRQPPGRAADARRRRATTSRSTSPTRRSSSSRTRRRSRPTSRSSSTTAPAPPRAAPRAEGVGGQVQGQVRHGLRGLPRARLRAAEEARASSPTSAELSPINPYVDDDERTTARPGRELDTVRPWDSLSDDEKRLFCRMAEVYAGFLSHADHEIGRLLDYLEESGAARQHDRSCSSPTTAPPARAARTARSTRTSSSTASPTRSRRTCKYLDELGSPRTYNHYPTGWAWAFNTPFKLWKRYANYEGGTADPMIVSWPTGITATGRPPPVHPRDRHRPDALRVPRRRAARRRQGLHAAPARGRQLRRDASTTPDATTGKETQFYSMLGTRAIWHKGWKAAAVVAGRARTSWGDFADAALGAVRHRRTTRASATTSPSEHPEKLQELIALWWAEAGTYSALPLEIRGAIEILGDRAAAALEAARPLRLLPGRRRGAGVGRAEHPQPLVHDRRRGRRSTPTEAGGVLFSQGVALRRPRPLRQGRQAQVRLQLRRRARAGRRVDRADPDRPRRPLGVVRAGGRRDAGRGHAHPPHPRRGGRRGPDQDPARQVLARRRGPQRRQGRRRAGHRRLPGRAPVAVRRRHDPARRSIDVSGEPFVDLAEEARMAFARD